MTLYEDLKWRGLIKDITSPDLERKLNEEKLTFYIGTDPTADSMHIGHYSSFLISKRLAKYGHHPLLLVGGATGRIGDPKPTSEREMKTIEEINHNVECLAKQAKEIFGFEIVNNYDWSKDINFMDFLRDYGKYFNINYMLDKDIIRRRLETGITYTEFSYMIMQAMDFLYLFEHKNCTLQVAGSDQWGNITAGVDLIKKKTGKEAYGFTMPLVLDSNGNKFGKTEGNALWLDKEKTSPYELYQYLINTDDSTVIDYLKKLTFLTKEEIESIAKEQEEHPETRIAQKELAKQIITDIHGESEYLHAKEVSESLFTGKVANLTDQEIATVFKGVPTFAYQNIPLIDLLVENKIASSKREAREFLSANAITVNGEVIQDENYILEDKKYNIIRRGKKKYFLIEKDL
ncbi:TPA: tyrosine--tRNA ligase [Candidatus Ventrenecus stercoripullorum]|nr:tyrosine--tRNA ligase [Candidatus Ventrenecus stercoripullorum]